LSKKAKNSDSKPAAATLPVASEKPGAAAAPVEAQKPDNAEVPAEEPGRGHCQELLKVTELPEFSGDVAAFIFENERPLKGLLGLLDWRLCGQISQLILAHHISGKEGEKLLSSMHEYGESPWRLFVFGLGKSRDFNQEKAAELAELAEETLKKAGAKECKIILPKALLNEAAASLLQEAWPKAGGRTFLPDEAGA
jgi:hypothetical protein